MNGEKDRDIIFFCFFRNWFKDIMIKSRISKLFFNMFICLWVFFFILDLFYKGFKVEFLNKFVLD